MKGKIRILIAILLMSVVQMGTVVISSILANVSAAFPEAGDSSVQFLMTFPSLMVLVSSVISAPLSGRIPKKYIASVGGFLFALSGLLSWLVHGSLFVLFVWAGMMGIGIGLVVPMATSLIADCFPEDKQPAIMGWQSSASNAGGMIMTFVGGWLAEGHWSLTYLVYLIAIPGAICALAFVPKKPQIRSTSTVSDAVEDRSLGMLQSFVKGPVLFAFITAFFATMLYNNVPTNISMFMTERSLGTSSAAGIASALLLLASAVSGILFGKVAGKIGRYVKVLGFSVMLVGELIIAFSHSLALVYVGCLIGGTALSFIMPQAMFEATQVKGVRSEMATMITLAGSYLGAFATPFITMIAGAISGGPAVAPRLIISAVAAGAVAAAIAIINTVKR